MKPALTRLSRSSLICVSIAITIFYNSALIVLAIEGGIDNPPIVDIGTLKNPLGNVTITQFFIKIIDIVLVFAVPIIVLFIIWAGFKYVTAGGNATKIQDATRALTWSLIGGVLILGAKILLTIIENTVNALKA